MTPTSDHRLVSREFMQQAQAELDAGDLIQASNSAWRATTRAFKAVAEPRGWPHSGPYDYYRIIARLEGATDRNELGRGFATAQALEENFYEGWLSESMVRRSMGDVARLVDELHLLIDADIPIEKRADEKKRAALTKDHRLASLIFMDETETELDAGDMKRASEKAWGAATRAAQCDNGAARLATQQQLPLPSDNPELDRRDRQERTAARLSGCRVSLAQLVQWLDARNYSPRQHCRHSAASRRPAPSHKR